MKNLSHRLTIEQLCNLVGCSSRTLHQGFKERYGSSPGHYARMGSSPGHYARMVALNAVRRQLRNLSQHRTLTDVAMDMGFYHLGRFSQHAYVSCLSHSTAQQYYHHDQDKPFH